MPSIVPSRTAMTAAAARAAHPLVDSPPHLHTDPSAVPLLGDQADELIGYHRRHGAHPVLAGARLQVACRARFAQTRLADAVRAGVRQYVVLGAGLDTWGYRPDRDPDVQVFEVDHAGTQHWKLDRLRAAGIPVPPSVRHVPADLETDALTERLAAQGFRPQDRALISWLGCTMYLSRAGIRRTLTAIAGLAPGTELVLDYLLPRALQDELGRGYADAVAAFSAEQGEPWLSQFSPDELAELLTDCGLSPVRDVSQRDAVEAALWNRSDGLRPSALQRLAIARVPG